MCVINI